MSKKRLSIAVVGTFAPDYVPGSEENPFGRRRPRSPGDGGKNGRSPEQAADPGRFADACRALGYQLAARRHRIVLYVKEWPHHTIPDALVCEPLVGVDPPGATADDVRNTLLAALATPARASAGAALPGANGPQPALAPPANGQPALALPNADPPVPEAVRQHLKRMLALSPQATLKPILQNQSWLISDGPTKVRIEHEGPLFVDVVEPSACDSVLEGAAQAALEQSGEPVDVIISVPSTPDDSEIAGPTATMIQHPPRGLRIEAIDRVKIRNNYPETFPSVINADAIILLSGEILTEMVACVAHYVKDRPVIAVTTFGGAARAMYGDIFSAAYRPYHTLRSVGTHLPALHRPWDGVEEADRKHAGEIVALTEQIVWKKRADWQPAQGAFRRLLPTFFFVLLWVGLLALLVSIPFTATLTASLPAWAQWALKSDTLKLILLWLLLFVAAFLGSQLRLAIAYRSDDVYDLATESSSQFVTVVMALVLSLGLGLVYFIGGWSFAGSATLPKDNTQVISAAAVMSLLGLAGGFLLPVETLRGRLQEYITPKTAQE